MSGKRAINSKALTVSPKAPEWLDSYGKNCWERIVPPLVKEHLVYRVDLPILEAACDFYSRYRQSKSLNESKTALTTFVKLLADFGITPKAREALARVKKENSFSSALVEDEYDLEGFV